MMKLLTSFVSCVRGVRNVSEVPPERFWTAWEADIATRTSVDTSIPEETLTALRAFRQRRWETRRPSRAVTSALLPANDEPYADFGAVAEWTCRPSRFIRSEPSRSLSGSLGAA